MLSSSCLSDFLLLLCIVAAVVNPIHASSSPSPPLAAIDEPITLALEILPRSPRKRGSLNRRSDSTDSSKLLHSDSLRLTLSAFSQTFHLHLSPNHDLIHPAARISVYSSESGSPTLSRIEHLSPPNVLAYSGHVVHPSFTESRLREDAALLSRPDDADGNLGWARILVHHQGESALSVDPIFEGAFSVNGDIYHVMTKERYHRTKQLEDPHISSITADMSSSGLVVFRDSDRINNETPRACGHDHLTYNHDISQNSVLKVPSTSNWWDNPWSIFEQEEEARITNTSQRSRSKRDDVAGGAVGSNFVNSIGSTVGCPKEPRLVYMGVAADCQYTTQHGSVQNATTAILANWNTASALYKSTFNVSLGIIHIEVHEASCPSTPDPVRPWNVDCGSVTLNDRLSLFSKYRATLGNDGAGLWHLMSGCPTGTEVGVAWLGTLCNQQATSQGTSVVSGTAVSTAGRSEWQVVAHEIGHNFGAIHDCQSGCNSTTGCCPLSASVCDANSKFLMSPVSSASEVNFSPCSIGNICSLMQSTNNAVNTTCLLDPNQGTQTIISLQMCGNGIVEDGEDCDPGSSTNSTCCNASTCKFANNAKCDPANDLCCTNSCQIAPATQICRPAISGGCDIAETCTGNSSKCPSDVFQPNGQSCGANGLACASGQCTSISQQCATVGLSMNLTTQCSNNQNTKTCQISCQNPQDSNSCVVLQSQLIDGSPCGYGGTCVKGNCNAGPLLDTIKDWYVQNLQISIPVSIVVGIVAILILWAGVIFIRRTCFSKRNQPPSGSGAQGPSYRINSWGPPVVPIGPPPVSYSQSQPPSRVVSPPIPPQLRAGSGRSRQRSNNAPAHWIDPTPWNGTR